MDVLTAAADGANRFDDERLLARATELERVLFSQDADFLPLVQRWLATGRPFSGLAYCHQRRLPVRAIIDDLELIALLEPIDVRNRVFHLPL